MCTEEDLVYIDSYIFGGLEHIGDAYRLDIVFEDKYNLFTYFYDGLAKNNDKIYGHLVNFGIASDNFLFSHIWTRQIQFIWFGGLKKIQIHRLKILMQ